MQRRSSFRNEAVLIAMLHIIILNLRPQCDRFFTIPKCKEKRLHPDQSGQSR